MWRAVRWVFAGLFVVSAALQYNDPDPLGWIGIYLAAAAASFVGDASRPSFALRVAVTIAATAWAIYLWGTLEGGVSIAELFQPMETRGGAVEIGREVFGLAIVVFWSLALSLASWRRISRAAP